MPRLTPAASCHAERGERSGWHHAGGRHDSPFPAGEVPWHASRRCDSLSGPLVLGTASTPRYTVVPRFCRRRGPTPLSPPHLTHNIARGDTYGGAGRDSLGGSRRLCRGAYLGTVAVPACALAQYERRSVPAGRTTAETTDLRHLLAWSHGQRRPRRSGPRQPRSPLILLNPPRPSPPCGEGRGEDCPTTLSARSRSRS